MRDEHERDAAANRAMDRYADGHDGAFDELYEILAPPLYRALFVRTRDPERAADLVQQTMLQLHLTRGRFKRGASVFPWAFALARRKLIDDARSHGRQPSFIPLPDGDEDAIPASGAVDEELDARLAWMRLEAALQRLPEDQRVAFALVRQQGLPTREAAAQLGITANALKLRAHRAYDALRAALHPKGTLRCNRLT
jgi:RNA polymerase sigma-70 factor (ECF subfamily)